MWIIFGLLLMAIGVIGILRRRQGIEAQRSLLQFLREIHMAKSDAYHERLGVLVPTALIAIGLVVTAVSVTIAVT
jgi:hypothetical protein